MSQSQQSKKFGLAYRLFTAVGLVLLIAAFFAPIWWVSLEAPQYPATAFPDGIRIHFHFNKVTDGCSKQVSEEVEMGEGMDCKEEMDTINHYVGMFPIAAGAPIEQGLSPYLRHLVGIAHRFPVQARTTPDWIPGGGVCR